VLPEIQYQLSKQAIKIMTNKGADRSQRTSRRTGVEPDDIDKDVSAGIATYDFEALSQGSHYILIRLAGEVYTLRKTQSGKLLLNK